MLSLFLVLVLNKICEETYLQFSKLKNVSPELKMANSNFLNTDESSFFLTLTM